MGRPLARPRFELAADEHASAEATSTTTSSEPSEPWLRDHAEPGSEALAVGPTLTCCTSSGHSQGSVR